MKTGSPFRDLAAAQGLIAVMLFLLIPFANAFGGTGLYRTEAVLHGLAASMTMLVATYTWHAYYSYSRGAAGSRQRLEWRLLVTNVLVLLTVIAGNWLYIGYQAPQGASEWFKLHLPIGHWVLMEYKEFVAFMAVPFGIVAAVLLRRFALDRFMQHELRLVVGILITLMWICLLFGFVFGIVLSKWKAI